MKKKIRNNGLTLVLLLFFTFSIFGQFYKGHSTYNDERKYDNLAPISRSEYLSSGHFLSSLYENMESEFLQMALFVYLSMFLYQKGSSESKKLPEELTEEDKKKEKEDEELYQKKIKQSPILGRLYASSLTLALTLLFIVFFFAHAYGSMKFLNAEKLTHNEPTIEYWDIFKENEFWFESFQNWQSEFFSIAALGILSIFLRQKDSAQSKKLTDPNSKTSNE